MAVAGSVASAGRRVIRALTALPRRVLRPVVDLCTALRLAPRVVRTVQARLCLLCIVLAAHPELWCPPWVSRRRRPSCACP